MDMDYMILKEASAKWGVTPRWINYFLLWWTYSRTCKDGNGLADTKISIKTCGWSDKTRERIVP